jgi:hypothetical protein
MAYKGWALHGVEAAISEIARRSDGIGRDQLPKQSGQINPVGGHIGS